MGDLENGSFPERKVEDFYFKQLKKFRVFDSPEGLPLAKSHLLAVSNKFGVCFVGCPTGLRIIKTEIIGRKNKEDERNINAVVSDYLSIFIDIGGPVRHVGVSCDNMTLSVCYEQGNNIMFRVYDIPTICSQNGSQEMLGEVALSTDVGISLVNLLWNPAVQNLFATCFSNGSVAMWEMTDTKINKTGVLPISTRATAICWSPKGKQIVVGHKDGHLTQFTPTLEVKKETPPPEIFKDTPHQVTSICWISAAVFLNVYTTEEEGDVPQCVLVCNQTKTSPKQIINFDDVYFGMNEDREKGFYTMHLQEWNVTLSVSCNAFEVAVFGNEEKWEKWTFEDEHRAEMPLTAENEETYPMGMAIDLTSNIPIVENERSYPPAPILLLLSTDGLLCPFYMVNKNPKAKHDIVKVAEPLPPPGQRSKITGAAAPPQSKTSQQEGAWQQQPQLFQLHKTAPNTGPPQLTMQTNLFPSSTPSTNTRGSLSFTPSGSSLPTSEAVKQSPFSFTEPTIPSFTSTQAKTAMTESKAAPSSVGLSIPSSKPRFISHCLFPNVSLPLSDSGFLDSGFSTASTGVTEKTISQQSSTKPSSQNLFSNLPAPTLPDLDKPSVGSSFKPMPTSQAMTVPRETDPLKATPTSDKPLMLQLHQQQIEQEQMKKQQIQKQQQEFELQKQQQQQQLKKQQELRQQQLRQQQIEQEQMKKQETQKQQQEIELLKQRQQQQQLKKQQELRQEQLRQQQIEQEQMKKQQEIQKQERQQQLELQQLRQQKLEQQQPEQVAQQQQQLRLQQSQPKQSTTQHENLEVSVSKCISEEIQLFRKELNKLGKDVLQMKEICSEFLQADELKKLRRETENEAKICDDFKQVIKDHNIKIQDAKKNLLSSFEILEDARVRHHRAKDPRYLHLLKSRGLDPMNANKMKTIRELYMHLDKTLSEVNLALDEEWNKENESRNKLQRPAMDAIYRTLKSHHMVAQEQSVKLDKIAEKMKRKKLLSPSWNKPFASAMSSRENMNELSSLEGSMKSLDLETTTRSPVKIPDNIPVNKSAQLINMLRKRQTTPIRRSTVFSPDTSRAKQIQRRLADPITTLSPPSQKECVVAETPLTRSTTNCLFSSTPAMSSDTEKAFLLEEMALEKNREVNLPQKPRVLKQGNVSQSSRQSQGLFISKRFPQSTAPSETTGPKLFSKNIAEPIATSSTPSLSNTSTVAKPQMTGPRKLFDTAPPSPPQSTGAPTLTSAATTATAATSRTTATSQVFNIGPEFRSTATPPRSTATPPQSAETYPPPAGFSMFPQASGKSQEAPTLCFIGKPGAISSNEAALKLPSSFPGDKTSVSLNQVPQSIQFSSSRGIPSQAALAAINRAEKMSAEQNKLDPSANIEPRSMVTYGQSSGGRVRDTESETSNARIIAEEALKQSQLEAEKAGIKPQSSMEFVMKSTENPKPGPPVMTAMPISSKDKVPAPNVTVKPVPLPATSLARPSIVPTSFLASASSSNPTSGFSFGPLRDSQPAKGSVGLQSSALNPSSFSLSPASNVKKETDFTPALSLGSESSIQPKSIPLNSGIVKPNVPPSPGVSRQLFKDTSNQINDQKEPSTVAQDLQTSAARTNTLSGNSAGLQLGPSKENVPLVSQTSASKPNTAVSPLGSSFGFKLGSGKESPFTWPTTGSTGFASVPGKEAATSDSSNVVKPFSASSSFPGFSSGQPMTAPSNVFRPFASIPTTPSSISSSTPPASVTSSSLGLTTSKPLSSFVTKKERTSTSSITSSSGDSAGGLFTGTPKTTAPLTTAVASVTSPAVVVATSAGETSSFSLVPSGQGTLLGSISTSQRGTDPGNLFGSTPKTQVETSQGGLFGLTTPPATTTATVTQEGASQKGLFGGPTASESATVTSQSASKPSSVLGVGVTTTAAQGGTSQGALFGATTTTSQGGTSQGGLFCLTPPSTTTATITQEGASQKGLFGGPTASESATVTSQSASKPSSVLGVGVTTSAAQGGTSQGGLFGGTTTTSQGGTSQGGLFGTATTTSPGGTSQGGLFGAATTTSQGGTSQGGLFGATTTTSQGGTLQGGLFCLTPPSTTTATVTQEGASQKGLFGGPTASESVTVTSQSASKPSSVLGVGVTTSAAQGGTSQGALFGTATTTSQGGTSQGSLFGTATTTSPGGTSQGGLFGAATTTSQGGTSQGGLSGTTTTTSQGGTLQGGLFCLTPPSTTTATVTQEGASQKGLFGGPTASESVTVTSQSASKPSSVLGVGVTTSAAQGGTSQGGLFGGTTTTSQGGTSQRGLFGTATTTSQEGTSQGGLFGTATTTSPGGSPQGGLIGATTTTSQAGTSQGGFFGTATMTSQEATSQGGLFGAIAMTSQGGLFGAATTTSPGGTSQGGHFGTATTTSQGGTLQGGLFGATTTTSQGGLFGAAPAASHGGTFQGGLFGSSRGETSQGGPFGSSQANQGGLFGAKTTSQAGTGLFGSPSSPTSSAFGQPSFGQPAFGQPISTVTSATSSTFGPSAFSKPQEISSTGIGLGFSGFGLGGQPSQQADKNPFLASAPASPIGTSLFGVNTSSTGFKPPFGSGSPSTFGSPSSSSGFGGGSFSKGTGNVASSGFAVGGAGSSGFGGSPSFGGAPAFESSQSFGAAPAFGSAPVFGSSPQIGNVSPGGVFGGSQGTSSFGNVSGSPIFGALARQSTTPSFGNVAQQAQPGFGGFGQQSTGFGGFGSPGGGTGGSPFGGSSSTSFNQWR